MEKFIKPIKLKKGDTIGIVSPSGIPDPVYVRWSTKIAESWGLKVKVGKYVFCNVKDFKPGHPEEVIEDFKTMANDPRVRIIWPSCGGYSSFDVIDGFQKEIVPLIIKNRKILIGYSDICTFENALTTNKYVSLHGPNFSGVFALSKKSVSNLKEILFEGKSRGVSGFEIVRPVKNEVTGRLMAANLHTLITCLGTSFDPLAKTEDKVILALEETAEEKSLSRRFIQSMGFHEWAKNIAAFALGRFTYMTSNDYPKWLRGKTMKDIFLEVTEERMRVPIVKANSWGHYVEKGDNKESFMTLGNGIISRLYVRNGVVKLEYLEEILE